MRKRAHIVVGLGFGDEGKGSIVDALVRKHDSNLVVRFNGGGQAGHNVVCPEGRHHTFSQWGSGTFVPGCQTLLSRFMVVHPTAMLVEAEKLESVGIPRPLERLIIDRTALVNTPFHQAANRITEIWRTTQDEGRHGSCGVGFGSTVEHAFSHPADSIHFGDIEIRSMLRKKLARIQEAMRAKMHAKISSTRERVSSWAVEMGESLIILEDTSLLDKIVDRYEKVFQGVGVADEQNVRSILTNAREPVFEGAQGVLLDENYGFHPYTTWSTTTDRNAHTILGENRWLYDIESIGVMRAFMTRHGRGPMPTEDNYLTTILANEKNETTPWQEHFRVGWLDFVLLRYAISCMKHRSDSIALNHLDCIAKVPNRIAYYYEVIEQLNKPKTTDLQRQERLGNLISKIRVDYGSEYCQNAAELIARIQEILRVSVKIKGTGPSVKDKEFV